MKKPNGKAAPAGGRFVRLSHEMLASEAWQSLSVAARALYIEITARHNGRNNGTIPFSCREACARLRISTMTACRAFAELQTAGLLTATRKGWNSGNFKQATRWQINDLPMVPKLVQHNRFPITVSPEKQ